MCFRLCLRGGVAACLCNCSGRGLGDPEIHTNSRTRPPVLFEVALPVAAASTWGYPAPSGEGGGGGPYGGRMGGSGEGLYGGRGVGSCHQALLGRMGCWGA